MWIVRDVVGSLLLFESKPVRCNNVTWSGAHFKIIYDETLFPNLKWEDEPIEVELTIKKQ